MTGEIFALDIGTRSIVGLVGVKENNGFKVLAAEVIEHSTRAMLDGQIHDINAVSEVVTAVKSRLENRLGRSLTEVAVAAAGRSLRTVRGCSEIDTFSLAEITRHQTLELELGAVQQAQAVLSDEGSDSLLYQCVGYSVVGYKLDGSPMTTLLNHRGSQIAAEVIATFLPRSVVDSLYSVLKNSGLIMKTLTLEPIAALSVVIPPKMRNLNLALVDVGAGTSDIALVSEGTICNYAMVPMAGDEITEYLSSEYLLDFNVGERLKRSLSAPILEFQDVLGVTHQVDSAKIVDAIKPGVETLAKAIADKLLSLNGRVPSAVFLIGGGSLTPGLGGKIAEYLGISGQRVAVRSRETIPGIFGDLSKLSGPESITPIGIAVNSLNDLALNLLHVEINKRPVRLFSLNQGSVADALLAAGLSLRKLHGKPGLALSVTVNGKLVVFKGEMGVSATIKRNGEDIELDTPLAANDCLLVTPARDGTPGKGTVRDAIPDFHEFKVRINGSEVKVVPRISMNNSFVTPQTALVDRAEILWEPINTVGELLEFLEVDPPFKKDMEIFVNGDRRSLQYTLGSLKLNDKTVVTDAVIKDGDRLELLDESYPRWRVRDVIPHSGPVFVDITLNGNPRSLPGPRSQVKRNDQPAYGDELLQEGDRIDYIPSAHQLIFSDLFRYIDFQPSPPPGKKKLIMAVNDQPADFLTPVQTGDRVTLYWV